MKYELYLRYKNNWNGGEEWGWVYIQYTYNIYVDIDAGEYMCLYTVLMYSSTWIDFDKNI